MPKIKIIKKTFCLFPVLFLFIFSCQDAENIKTDYNITCYAAAYNEGIYKSDNGGKSWYSMKMDQEHIHLYFKRIFMNPEEDTLYVATTGAGLFTIDLKENTIQSIEEYKGQNVRSVAFTDNIDIGKPGVLVGMFEEGISRIGSGEDEYLNEGLVYRDVNTIVTRGNNIFAGTARDIFKWDNKSKTWVSSSQGIKNKNIISMDATPKGDVLYAGSGGYYEKKGMFESIPCLYISRDNGENWKEADDGLPNDTLIYSIAVNKLKPARFYIGTSDGVYMSDESGDGWVKTDDGLPDDFRVFDIKTKRMDDGNDVVYVAGSNGVFMAVDTDDPKWLSKNYGLPKTNITGIVVK